MNYDYCSESYIFQQFNLFERKIGSKSGSLKTEGGGVTFKALNQCVLIDFLINKELALVNNFCLYSTIIVNILILVIYSRRVNEKMCATTEIITNKPKKGDAHITYVCVCGKER